MQVRTLYKFLKLESSAGIVLFVAAVLALIIENTPWHIYYEDLLNLPLSIQFGPLQLIKPIFLWINDGLMTIFFLLVGLKIKRAMFEGELNSLSKASLPVIAGVGGMIVPAIIYITFNWSNPISLWGWAIPTATDIAFSLGILCLLGNRLPIGLKIFLIALAIFDDIGAILIILIFYTHHICLIQLLSASLFLGLLFLFNRLGVTRITAYILIGIALWFCVLKSGIHATLTGILLAFMIPIRDQENPQISPLRNLEDKLHFWVAFGVLPVFAFANAGVSFAGMSVDNLLSPVTLGIALGLFLGKQIGIWLTSWLAIKAGWAHMPYGGNWGSLYGISLLAGVGFSMSLFIGTLAFSSVGQYYPGMVRLGIITGSLIAGISGYLIILYFTSSYRA
ncbi:Na+/H+ antiporter NhaA [Coxiella endosymbiont of Rhipicephalus microplus]|uniref:Na+/H+ antiporter NhaA n=1 Tax=Coxiella endosymbiont of Rhipicephalus microplus TaxID=1656186 RepID=UPI000C7FC199|nr:Na+/H+ antiporter NhaA [Coxiella endosymbiont of Rhipicephalus microplus]PMB54566.1 Na+/H+ antiporter NhaA type [Coxiella-like endosymbiont]